MILRTTLSLLLLACTIGLYEAKGQSTQEAPVVIWASSPVQPGETVLIHGGNFGKNPLVELTSGSKKQAITPISVSEASVMFVYPEAWEPGIASGVVKSGKLVSKSFQLNAPDVWWVHGDRGREASTKLGNLKLIGNCLAVPEQSPPQVSLQNVDGGKQGKTISLRVVKHNRFFIQTSNWDEIPAGMYEVILAQTGNSQPVTAGKIRISEKKEMVPKEVFNVVDFGAVPSDGIDDTQAILNAVEQLKKNNGGVLFFPMGRFQMNETIELPPYSILRGLGANNSQIYWPDTNEPLGALIRGTHSFEVSNIFLTCGNHRDGIVGNGPEVHGVVGYDAYKNGNISIINVTLRMLYSQFIIDNMDELKRRLPPLHMARALRLGGENINVTGNNIYCAAGGVFEFRAYWSNISNNIFSRGNIIGWNGFRGQQLIFMDNHLGGANTTAFYAMPEGSENIYWGNNYQENSFDGNNRESFSGDLRIIAYQNTVKNITPNSFTTIIGITKLWVTPSIFNSIGEVQSPGGKIDIWKNGAVQIASGKGVGQIRRIKSIDGAKIELESAWDITPDESSVITITSFRRRFIYTENRADDSSIALQFYGSMIEGIVANNVTSRTGGYTGDSNRDLLNWFNQFFDNTIETGLAFRGPRNQIPAIDAHIGLLGSGSEFPVIRSCIIRNNELKSSAKLDVIGNSVDCLFEKNKVSNANVGVTIDDAARNIVLRNNIFKGVYKPYEYSPQSVVIRPAEELLSAMDGVSALMGWQSREDMPAEWQEIYTNKELVNSTSDQLIVAWEKAVKAFAKQNADKPISDKVAETLLGIQIHAPNWQTMNSILREGKAGGSSLMIRVPDSRVKAHLKLSVRLEDFPFDGWKIAIPEFDLKPGKNAELKATITKPEGKVSMLRIPLKGELSGAGWKLNFVTTIADSQDKIILDQFRISQPLDNPLGKQRLQNVSIDVSEYTYRIGYIKYGDIPKPEKDQLVDASTQSGSFAFGSLYADSTNEGKVIYGISAIRARSPVTVRFQFSNNCLFFVNGKIVGTTRGRGQWGFVRLEEGENKVEMLMLPLKSDKWRVGFPFISWIGKTGVIEL